MPTDDVAVANKVRAAQAYATRQTATAGSLQPGQVVLDKLLEQLEQGLDYPSDGPQPPTGQPLRQQRRWCSKAVVSEAAMLFEDPAVLAVIATAPKGCVATTLCSRSSVPIERLWRLLREYILELHEGRGSHDSTSKIIPLSRLMAEAPLDDDETPSNVAYLYSIAQGNMQRGVEAELALLLRDKVYRRLKDGSWSAPKTQSSLVYQAAALVREGSGAGDRVRYQASIKIAAIAIDMLLTEGVLRTTPQGLV